MPTFQHRGAVPMRQWTPPMLEAWIDGHDWSPRTEQMTLTACRRFIAWARKANVACPDFAEGVQVRRQHQAEVQHLTIDQLEALLRVARSPYENRTRPHKLELLIGLAALAGHRYGELLASQVSYLDLKGGSMRIRGAKSYQDRRVPIDDQLEDIIRRHPVMTGPLVRGCDNRSNARRALRWLCVKADVPLVHWHGLRHTYGTSLAAAGVDVTTIGRLMGHKPGSTVTLRYLHTDPERMRDAVDKARALRAAVGGMG